MNRNIRLSPSTLNLFLECPRCFWLHINKRIQRPRGIFPSLPGGMDLVIKDYFDCEYRGKIEAKNKGKIAMYFVKRIKEVYSEDNDGFIPKKTLLDKMRI